MSSTQAPDLDVVALTQALVRCASITPADLGAQAVLATAAEQAGFAVQRLQASNAQGRTVHNLYARLGTGRPTLAFVGHTDVVPVGDPSAWTHPPFAARLQDGVLVGRGTADMKGAIAAFLVASQRFARQQPRPPGSIALMITGDEEVGEPEGMRALRQWCLDHAALPDAGIIGEAASAGVLGQGLRVGRRGSLNAVLHAQGRLGHVAYPERAENAIDRLLHGLQALQALDLGPADGIFRPSNLTLTNLTVPNTATNVVPDVARASFNVRFNPRHTGASLVARLQAEIAQAGPQLRLEAQISGEPFACTSPLLADLVADAIAAEMGPAPDRNAGGGTSDGRFLASDFPVVEFGLLAESIHRVDEHAAVADLHRLSAIYLGALAAFFRRWP